MGLTLTSVAYLFLQELKYFRVFNDAKHPSDNLYIIFSGYTFLFLVTIDLSHLSTFYCQNVSKGIYYKNIYNNKWSTSLGNLLETLAGFFE